MRFSLFTLIVVSIAFCVARAAPSCPVGSGWNGNNCQQCQAGMSSNGKGGGCERCPANTYSEAGKACKACPDGQGSDNGNPCQSCNEGWYSSGGSGCKRCDPGFISNRGAKSCSPCAPGYYSNGANTACQECSAGTYQDLAGQTQCKDCPTGHWQEKQAKTYCDICPCGTYKDQTRGTKCDSCGNAWNGVLLTSNQGATNRNQCFMPPSGSYKNSDQCSVTCPAGTFSNNPQSGSCTSCGPNSVAQPGSTTCTTCATGTAPDATKASCTPTSTARVSRSRRDVPFCPRGHAACQVSRNRKMVIECIDTSSDITSCGGCPGEGEDCTTFDPLATASCVAGSCAYTCPRGYNLTPSGCERVTNGAKLRSRLQHRTVTL